jgi:hypothetical protein
MVSFTAPILQFSENGEKTGWMYIVISKKHAHQLKPHTKVSFRVKGTLDSHPIQKTALLPIGDGKFMLPINAAIRKATGKKSGDKLKVSFARDERKIILSADLMKCLKDDPEAMKFFKSLPGSHQKYFSNWIEGAKTAHTKTKRIVTCLTAFNKKMNYAEMMRSYKNFEG